MAAKISSTNTKAQILEAYEKLQKQLEEKANNNPKEVQERKEHTKTLEKTAAFTPDTLQGQLLQIKQSFDKSLQELQDKIIAEYQVLADIQKSVKIEKQNLQDLYDIRANADTLAASLIAQKENKEAFETEMQEKKAALALEIREEKEKWDLQKQKNKEEEKEYTELLKKNRKREEEEYTYTLEKSRQEQKDKLAYEMKQLNQDIATKRHDFEKEYAEREQRIVSSEKELADLNKQVADFPTLLEEEIKKAISNTEKELKTKYQFEKELREKEVEGNENLYKQEIELLKAKIAELQTQIQHATDKANDAEQSVKDIALRAIDGATKFQIVESKKIEKE